MRDGALEPMDLNDRNLVVVDVGGGTGFATEGVVKYVDAKNMTLLDQSPEHMAKAKRKPALKEVTVIQGDTQDLPFPTDYADRYVSAGSIEYWPDPQRGIKEAYRVLKPGGKACMIGPVYPTFWLSRIIADVWMLFPKEEEYFEWYKKAGFVDVKLKKIGPSWYRGVRRHGLIIGCSVVGTKPAPGDSPLQHYWPDPQRGIKEGCRVLKSGGFVDVKLKRIAPSWYRGVRRHGLIMWCSDVGTKPAPGDSPLQMGFKIEDMAAYVYPVMFFIRFILEFLVS